MPLLEPIPVNLSRWKHFSMASEQKDTLGEYELLWVKLQQLMPGSGGG